MCWAGRPLWHTTLVSGYNLRLTIYTLGFNIKLRVSKLIWKISMQSKLKTLEMKIPSLIFFLTFL